MKHKLRPYSGTEGFIFISYSHRDAEEAMEIISRLMENGFRVWYDEGIDPGSEWDENIADHINRCDTVLALMSANYLKSDNCKDELNFARDLNKDRLLVYLENIQLPPGMAMRLNRLQAIHKYTYGEGGDFYKKLFDAPPVKRNRSESKPAPTPSVAQAPIAPTPAPVPPPAPKAKTMTEAELIQEVEDLIEKFDFGADFFESGTEEFSTRIAVAQRVYANFGKEEIPLFLSDESLLANGTQGMVLTDKKLYVNTARAPERTVSLASIEKLDKRLGPFRIFVLELFAKGEKEPVPLFASSDEEKTDRRMAFFTGVFDLLQGLTVVKNPPASPKKKEEKAPRDLGALTSATVAKYGVGGTYFANTTPQFAQRIAKANAAYAKFTANETPLLLEDFSVTGSAKEGIVLTDRTLFINNKSSRQVSLPLARISEVRCEALSRKSFCVTVHTPQGEFRTTANSSEPYVLACAGCLSELITELKKLAPAPTAASWTCPACGTACNGNFCPRCGKKR